MAYGLTSYGLEIPNYQEWYAEYISAAKNIFGNDVNLTDSSIIQKYLSIPAYQDIKIWQAIQACYSSQTLDGAEGIYLDEIFSRRGVFRKGATASSGYVQIISDRTADYTLNIDTSYSFTDSNGNVFEPTETQTLADNIFALKISKASAVTIGASVTVYIKNVDSGIINSQTFSTSSVSLLTDMKTFFDANISASDATPHSSISEDVLYVGYNAANYENPVGLDSPTKIYTVPSLGTKHSGINVKCVETGYKEIAASAIQTMSPTLTVGYVGITNLFKMETGSNVESDAEYRDRFNTEVDEALAATRPAIVKAVSDLSGVTKVKIYDNPNTTATAETPALTFHTIVIGGTTENIANTIYQKKPINTKTHGTTSYTVTTEDASTETIRFSYGTKVPYNVKIEYITQNGLALSSTEQTLIANAISDLSASFTIGGTTFNAQLQAAIFGVVGYSRLLSLTVYTKPVSSLDSAYSSGNVTITYDSLMTIQSSDIVYSQSF